MARLATLAAALSEQDTRLSDALRLSLVEGLSIRAIARRLKLTRKTVRRLLGRAAERTPPSSEPRGSLLDPYDAELRRWLDDTPELPAPAILERLRPLGYTGGITILRDRVRARCVRDRRRKRSSRSTSSRARQSRSTGPTSGSRCPGARGGCPGS